MYSNKNGIDVDNHGNFRRPLNYNRYPCNEKQFVRSLCPKCGIYHNVHMLWTGRGLPRIFCGQCKAVAARYDDTALSEPSIVSAGHTRKRGNSAGCE